MEKIKSWGLGYGLDDHEAEVEVEMADPNSPIYSTVDSFEALDLNPSILKGIQVGMKFSRPSKIQETALPLILTEPRTNLIAQSQSGTGKTAAFVVGMLSVVDIDNPLPQALCLAPTRELAVQTFGTVGKMGEYTGFKIHCMVSQDKDKKKNKKKGKSRRRHVDPVDAQVVVGTPGTILNAAEAGALDLSAIRVYVLDEADFLIDAGGNMSDNSIRLKNLLPEDVQVLLFSATFDDEVWEFAEHTVGHANKIRLKREEVRLKKIQQFKIPCPDDDGKFAVVCDLYEQLAVGQMIIFCQTIKGAQALGAKLIDAGHTVSVMTSRLLPSERDTVIGNFRDGVTKVLVATDVLARGIDVQAVNIVVNYDMPCDGPPTFPVNPATYIHRIGRAGRFGRAGVALNLVSGQKANRDLMAIEQYYSHDIPILSSDAFHTLDRVFTEDIHSQALVTVDQTADADDLA